jgi:hypothetical protein
MQKINMLKEIMQMEINMDNYRVTFQWGFGVLSLLNQTSPCKVHWSNTLVRSKDEDSCGGASNGDATFFHQTRLDFEFDFRLIGLELSLIEIGESTNSPTLCLKCVQLIKTR